MEHPLIWYILCLYLILWKAQKSLFPNILTLHIELEPSNTSTAGHVCGRGKLLSSFPGSGNALSDNIWDFSKFFFIQHDEFGSFGQNQCFMISFHKVPYHHLINISTSHCTIKSLDVSVILSFSVLRCDQENSSSFAAIYSVTPLVLLIDLTGSSQHCAIGTEPWSFSVVLTLTRIVGKLYYFWGVCGATTVWTLPLPQKIWVTLGEWKEVPGVQSLSSPTFMHIASHANRYPCFIQWEDSNKIMGA